MAIQFRIDGNVAVIQLSRPEKLNAFNRQMALELQAKLDACNISNAVRAVYITGTGKAFSAGQDLEEVVEPTAIKVDRILIEHYNPIVRKIRKLEKPVVAAVNGVAAGAAANIALCCDVVVAAKTASFVQAFSKIGLIPDSGGTFFLPRLVGWQKASALSMLGEKVSAEEAERMGMIYKVYNDDVFGAESLDLARRLSEMPTRALAFTKQALNNSFINNYENQLHDEELLQEKASETKDYKEGVQAFLEKRKPIFTGE
ncbi:MAG TPA: enoyl-CoA hydratase-related protein [Chitinophagaceae bacterium]|jgi:2-(1,2-epoxy-1,2-dihydrophenyl)acetyl-CoA isomerase|nr:enoyl-CoA hydratase-related protein [Chitinophagaceae bacterium]